MLGFQSPNSPKGGKKKNPKRLKTLSCNSFFNEQWKLHFKRGKRLE